MDPEEIELRKADLKLRERETAVKENELALKQEESKRFRLSNPALVAVIAAIAALLGAWLQYQQQRNALELEQRKFQSGIRTAQIEKILTALDSYSSTFTQGAHTFGTHFFQLQNDVRQQEESRKCTYKKALALERRYNSILEEMSAWLQNSGARQSTLEMFTGISGPSTSGKQGNFNDFLTISPPTAPAEKKAALVLQSLRANLDKLQRWDLAYIGDAEAFMNAVRKSISTPSP